MNNSIYPLDINSLDANHITVSVHKYGFFLCKTGSARILLGNKVYQISDNHLCLYTPNTFFQIIDKSADLQGYLEQGDVDTLFPAISSINIRKRLQIRKSPCVKISAIQSDNISALINFIHDNSITPRQNSENYSISDIHKNLIRYLEYALCMTIIEAYFGNTPVEAVNLNREDSILNNFIIDLYENCRKTRTVKFYADLQHLSPYYFSTIIKRQSGKSALQWIGNVTMIFAKQYLECSQMSVKEIADTMNFPDQSTFGRYFRHFENCSPSTFREKKAKLSSSLFKTD